MIKISPAIKKTKGIELCTLPDGSGFLYCGGLYIILPQDDEESNNVLCFCLSDNDTCRVADTAIVQPVDIEVTWKAHVSPKKKAKK